MPARFPLMSMPLLSAKRGQILALSCTVSLSIQAGCTAPSAACLDMVQAAQLDSDQTQVSLSGGGEGLASIGLRRTFRMDRAVAVDAGFRSGITMSSLDAGIWFHAGDVRVRVGAMGGMGQTTWAALSSPRTSTGGGMNAPFFRGHSIHVQHALGSQPPGNTGPTPWTFTHGYAFSTYHGASRANAEYFITPSIDASFRRDFKPEQPQGTYMAMGGGFNGIYPMGYVRIGLRM